MMICRSWVNQKQLPSSDAVKYIGVFSSLECDWKIWLNIWCNYLVKCGLTLPSKPPVLNTISLKISIFLCGGLAVFWGTGFVLRSGSGTTLEVWFVNVLGSFGMVLSFLWATSFVWMYSFSYVHDILNFLMTRTNFFYSY